LHTFTTNDYLDYIRGKPAKFPPGEDYSYTNNNLPELGHTGGGIGSGCILGYLSHNDTYNFIGINLGVSITPKIADSFEDVIDSIYEILLE